MEQSEIDTFFKWFEASDFRVSYDETAAYELCFVFDLPKIVEAYNRYTSRIAYEKRVQDEEHSRLARICLHCGSDPHDIRASRCEYCIPF